MEFLRKMVEIGMLCERANKVLGTDYEDIDFDNLFIKEDIVTLVESDDTGEEDFHLVLDNGMFLYFIFDDRLNFVEWSLWDTDNDNLISYQAL
jgi:hypothetical protein